MIPAYRSWVDGLRWVWLSSQCLAQSPRDPREHRVDEGPGVLRRFDVRKESLSVGLAVKGLVALLTGWYPVVRTP
jgi:hypothetical protein